LFLASSSSLRLTSAPLEQHVACILPSSLRCHSERGNVILSPSTSLSTGSVE
jgi:hypothetical protein